MDPQDGRSSTRRTFIARGGVAVSALAFGAGAAGASGGQEEGGRGTIQRRIDDASAGDTVEVDAGEYSGAVVVDKPLTLRAANAAIPDQTNTDRTGSDRSAGNETTGTGSTDGQTAGNRTSGNRTASNGTTGNRTTGTAAGPGRTSTDRATIDATGREHGIVVEADDVTVDGFEIVGDEDTAAGVTVYTEESEYSGITISRNYLTGMEGSAGSGGRQAFGVLSFGQNVVSDLTVTDNVVEDLGGTDEEDPQGVGINLQSITGDEPGAGGLVAGNEVRGMADGNLDVSFASPSGFDRSVPPYGVAVTIQPLDGDDSDAGSDGVIARRNTFENNSVDVVLGNRSNPMTSRVTANNFGDGGDFGVVNVGESLPASCNYWGHEKGPSHSNNLSGGGDIVLGKVDYRPWATDEVDVTSEAEVTCSGGETTGDGNG